MYGGSDRNHEKLLSEYLISLPIIRTRNVTVGSYCIRQRARCVVYSNKIGNVRVTYCCCAFA